MSGPELTSQRRSTIRRGVLDGADGLWRDLPWRATRDPWAVLVSEVMLQQTQVSRVVVPYGEFMAAFPTPVACAGAGPAEVVRRWGGLGYNRRAVNLYRCAREVCDRHGGAVPGELASLRSLPGIGDYTARAVLAFAYGADVGVVDTNVARLLARAVAGRPLRPAEAQALADQLVPSGEGWRFNQALFDLGAQVCRKQGPDCGRCALRWTCRWFRAGRPEPDPARGSAGTSRTQSVFAGSDRQGRGRLVAALRSGPVPASELAATAGWPEEPERARKIARGLADDGVAEWDGTVLTLPR